MAPALILLPSVRRNEAEGSGNLDACLFESLGDRLRGLTRVHAESNVERPSRGGEFSLLALVGMATGMREPEVRPDSLIAMFGAAWTSWGERLSEDLPDVGIPTNPSVSGDDDLGLSTPLSTVDRTGLGLSTTRFTGVDL